MRLKIDTASLNIEQARALVVHLDSYLDVITLANNKLVTVLGTVTSSSPNPAKANEIIDRLNEWSRVNNEMSEASAAEIRRIIEINETTPSTLQ